MERISFTEEEEDLVSQDFSFGKEVFKSKKQEKKKKVNKEFERPTNEIEEYEELNEQQKDMIKKNTIIKERILTIEKLLEMYPNLKKDRKIILDCVLGKKEIQKKCDVLEKLNVKEKNVYKDESGNILDDKINLIGFWFKEKDNTGKDVVSYMFFSEVKRVKAKITRNKNRLLKIDYTKL